jgi:hypothetical protein
MDAASDPQAAKRTLEHFFELWITPELTRRQEAGLLPTPVELRAAQVIMYPDARPVTVRINEEVRALAKIELACAKEAGDPIFDRDIAGVTEIKLTDNDDPNCGHATILLVKGSWHLAFDFRRNKASSQRHLDVARQFHRAAAAAAETQSWPVFVDTLFSAAELAAKAWLLLMADPEFVRRPTHRAIQTKYQTIGRLNVEPGFIDTLNKLGGWRDCLRYLKSERMIDEAALLGMLPTVAAMIDDAASRAAD